MKIYFNPVTDEWEGGAWLDRLHDAGYSVNADVARGSDYIMYEVCRMDNDEGVSDPITELFTEDELQMYIKLLIGSDDGDK